VHVRAGRAPVAEVKSDEARLLPWLAGQPSIAVSDVAVRRAMEAVPPHPVAAIEGIRDRVKVGVIGQGEMERRIEHRHLGDLLSKGRPYRLNTTKVVRVVQRGEVDRILDAIAYLFVDDDGPLEVLGAVHHPVAHCVYLGE